LGGGIKYFFRLAWTWGLTAELLAVTLVGLCPEHAPSNIAKAKPAMILAVDFIMCIGNEVVTGIV
jgi:hypothetical protein